MSARHRASVIAVGDELLLGRTLDTNSGWLARWCQDRGLTVVESITVGDDEPMLVTSIQRLVADSDLVLITGGLGPTEDDRTRHALAAAMGQPLRESKAAWKQIEAYWQRIGRGRRPANSNRRQALVPCGAKILRNDRGTAPGLLGMIDDTPVACLPGVPHEMKAMAARLAERLSRMIPGLVVPSVEEVHVAGIGESSAQDLLGELLVGERPRVGITAHELGHITIRPVGSPSAVKRRSAAVRRVLKQWLLPEDGLAPSLIAELARRRLTVTTAESCTCGRVAAMLGAVAGASQVLREGLIAYHNLVKETRLGVDQRMLERHGAVSEPVVRQMALGMRDRTGAGLALATSGIAGPGGGTKAKPVGTVWVAAAIAGRVETQLHQLRGDRDRIQQRAAAVALLLGWQLLTGRV